MPEAPSSPVAEKIAPGAASRPGDGLRTLAAVAAFALVLAWLAPSRLVLLGDDFGYVDSVAETIRTHRWTTSDWLEPLNLPLTAISAGLFALTANFYVSTLGFNLLLALAALVLLEINLRASLPEARVRWPVVLAVVLSPVWLHKAVEFTGVPFGLVCLLAAWHCWRRGWRLAFFLLVLLGALNRQSALCLLAWPLATLVQQLRNRAPLDRGLMAGGVLVAGVAGAALVLAPPTWARQLSQADLLRNFSAAAFFANVVLAVVVLVGWRAWVGLLQGCPAGETFRRNRAKPWPSLAVIVAGAGLIGTGSARLLCETPGWEAYSLGLVMLAAVLAWLHDWDRPLPLETALYLGAFILLVSWRGRWWDYYFLEPMLVLLLATVGKPRVGVAVAPRVLATVGLGLGLLGLPGFKQRMTELEAKTVAYEGALRRGELRVTELSDAPFGYLGWKLFPLARQQPQAAALSDFLKYVEGARARYQAGEIAMDRAPGGRKSIHPSRERWALPAGFQPRTLPLDNDEWVRYIHRRDAP